MEETWRDPVWLAEAMGWVDARLADAGRPRTGEVDQVHVRPWSTAIKVPTGAGPVWFKANTEELKHEALVTLLLARRVPDRVPPLIADDPKRGWMLMEDAGTRLREVIAEERDLSRWVDVLDGAADIARAMEPDVEQLLAAGVPDFRLAVLPDRYAALVESADVGQRYRDAVPWVRDMAEELASYDVTETLQHDDLHDGQVFVRGDRQLILDWGDAVISHPFFTLSVTLEGVVSWGLDDVEGSVDIAPLVAGYLRRYDPDRPELADAVPLAMRLGWACRAANGTVVEDPESTRNRLRMFLDGRA
ncbi:MAG: phosphotransferase [Nocardioides sp.]|nr:phosphotransferase [Nocardioides sp.]